MRVDWVSKKPALSGLECQFSTSVAQHIGGTEKIFSGAHFSGFKLQASQISINLMLQNVNLCDQAKLI